MKWIIIKRKSIYVTALLVLVSLIIVSFSLISFSTSSADKFIDPESGIIVIDPGHGGIDGGANIEDVLEKDINLDIGKKLKLRLVQKGYTVIMTREEDISLDNLDSSSQSRHQRDLNARTTIINNSNAQLFISIHVNSNFNNPNADGAIVFFSDKYQENKELAYYIQRTLNGMIVNGKKRTVHDPIQGKYFLLDHSDIPGAIVETAFISNPEEMLELKKDKFKEQLAEAIAEGAEKYLKQSGKVLAPEHGQKEN